MMIYIAGPMTGYEYFNYPAFNAAEATLRAQGYDTLNPAHSEDENNTGAPQTWEWYMRRALAMVLRSEGICLLEGWEQSRGANLELAVTNSLGLEVHDLIYWSEVRA